jgi:hypothetical protein
MAIVVSAACGVRRDCIPRGACGGNWFQLYVAEHAMRMFGADIACALAGSRDPPRMNAHPREGKCQISCSFCFPV